MAPHFSTLAWKIPWMEEPGRLQSMGSLRVGHDWATSFSLFTFHFHALEKAMAAYSSVLAWRIPGTGGAWWAAVYGIAQSRTRLKWLCSSSLRILEWVAYPFSSGSSRPRNLTRASCIAGRFFTNWAIREPFFHLTCLHWVMSPTSVHICCQCSWIYSFSKCYWTPTMCQA